MSLVDDIVRAYRAPRSVMQAQIDRGITEAQTLFYGMLFGVINLIASYPRIVNLQADPDMIKGMISGMFISYIFLLPLMLYALAGVVHWVLLKFGGKASWAEARRAFNWSAVCVIPFVLCAGAAYVFKNNLLTDIINLVIAAIFFWQVYANFKYIEFQK